MFRRWFVVVTFMVGILSIPLPGTGVANAAEINVLSAVAMKPGLDDLAPEFERRTGHAVKIAYATAGIVRDRIRDGETVDVAILPRSAFDPLLARTRLRLAPRRSWRGRLLLWLCPLARPNPTSVQ